MAYYDNIYVQHIDPYTPAEMRFLGAREAKGFLQRMRQRDMSPEVPWAFAQVLAQADAVVGVLMRMAAEGLPATPPPGERRVDDEDEEVL